MLSGSAIADSTNTPLQGEFPFCSPSRDRGDTAYVRWWRNRSNYLLFGGFWKKTNAAYQYMRGVFGNLVLLAPILVVAGLIDACAYSFVRRNPFAITFFLLVLLAVSHLASFLMSGIRIPYLDYLSRGRYWPTNIFIALLPIGLAFDSSPFLIEFFRYWSPFGSFGLQECLQLLAAIAAVSGVVHRFLSSHPKYGKNAALVILAVLSWSILGLVLLRLVNYLYFGVPPHGWFLLAPFISFGVVVLSIFITSTRVWWGCIVIGSVLGLLTTFLTTYFFLADLSESSRHSGNHVGVITRPLARLTEAISFEKTEAKDLSRLSKELLSQVVTQKRNLDAEAKVSWPEDYMRGHWFIDALPWVQRQLTFNVLKESTNLKIYQKFDSVGLQEWGVLTPVRPDYYQHAASYLELCSRLDRISSLDKQTIRQSLTHYGIRKLFRSTIESKATEEMEYQPQNHFLHLFSKDLSRAPEIDSNLLRNAVRAQVAQLFLEKLYPENSSMQRTIESTTLKAWSSLDYTDMEANVAHFSSIIGSISEVSNVLRNMSLPQSEQKNFDLISRISRANNNGESSSTDAALLGPKPFASVEKLEKIVGEVQCTSFVEALLFSLTREQLVNTGVQEKLLELLEKLPEKISDDPVLKLGDKHISKLRYLCKLNSFDLAIRAGLLDEQHAWVLYTNLPPDLRIKKFPDRAIFAKEYLGKTLIVDPSDQTLAQILLLIRAIENNRMNNTSEVRLAIESLGELYKLGIPNNEDMQAGNLRENELARMHIYREAEGARLQSEFKQRLLAYRFISSYREECDKLIRRMYVGRFGEFDNLRSMIEELAAKTLWAKILLVASILSALFAFGLLIDPNMTSLHRFYSDALSTAFFIRPPKTGSVNETGSVKEVTDTKLSELADYPNGSSAPFHLINVALNMQGSSLEELRDRQAIPFTFSPKFVGSSAAGGMNNTNNGKGLYVETSTFEQAHPTFVAATAMTISAGAASPNMGRYTSPFVRLAMVLVNLRLGYWIQNPLHVAEFKNSKTFTIDKVIAAEAEAIYKRRLNANLRDQSGFLGLAFSGGGIRSASLNFGIAQELFLRGIWEHVDYLSTVSGGGYVGTSISVFMRNKCESKSSEINTEGPPTTSIASKVANQAESELCNALAPPQTTTTTTTTTSKFFPDRCIANLERVWKVIIKALWFDRRCWCLLREALGQLEDSSKWMNVSDGGHIENLGVYALLQRQCEVIIAGDGEDDRKGVFDGLSRVMRLAEIDLGIKIEFSKKSLTKLLEADPDKAKHYAVARISYPRTGDRSDQVGWLLYLRSSFSGDEDQILKSYRACNSDFPHETTADQFFDETKFEAYRRLGQHIATQAITGVVKNKDEEKVSYSELLDALKEEFEQF